MEENNLKRSIAVMNKFLTVALLMGVAIFLFYNAPYFKPTETFKRGVMHLVVDDKDVTNSLPDPVYVKDDVVMMSDNTIMKYFDNVYVYFDKAYQTSIITTETYVGKIKIGENVINVNGEDRELKGTAILSGDNVYIPISSIQDITDVEINYNEKVIATTPLGWSRSKEIRVPVNYKLKAYKREIALTTGVARANETIYLFDTEGKVSGDYLVVRNERGDIGYCKFGKIEASEIIRLNQGDKVVKYKKIYDDIKYSLAWEYAQNYTPDRTGETKIDGLRVISPTWLEVKNTNGDISSTIDKEYIKWAKDQKYILWPSLKNDYISIENMDYLSAIMNDMKLRENLINNVVKIALENDFDGVNLDFENMYKDDKDVFSEFVREFAAILRANDLVCSVDVTIAGGSDTYSLCYDRTAIGKAADYVMLMAYDQYGDWSQKAGPVASISWVEENIQEMLNYEKVDKDKLFLCVPFYSRYWIVNSETNEKIRSASITMSQANSYLNRYRDNAKWSEEDGQYYIEVDLGNGTTMKIWVENEDAIQKKIELINKYDLAGVAAWRLGYEDGSKPWNIIKNTMNMK